MLSRRSLLAGNRLADGRVFQPPVARHAVTDELDQSFAPKKTQISLGGYQGNSTELLNLLAGNLSGPANSFDDLVLAGIAAGVEQFAGHRGGWLNIVGLIFRRNRIRDKIPAAFSGGNYVMSADADI